MEKLKKYPKVVLTIILVIAGVCLALFIPNEKIGGGLGCLFFGLAILVVAWIAIEKNYQNLKDFDIEANEILTDIAQKGENSEYYHFYNIEIIKKLRNKLQKKQVKQVTSLCVLSVLFIVISIICMV